MLPRYKRNKIRAKFLLFGFLFIFVSSIIFYKIDTGIKPVLIAVSHAEVNIAATETINRIVKEELTGNVKYSDFVSVKTNNSNEVTAVELNTVSMNKFGAKVSLRVQEELKALGVRGIGIPAGVITGSSLLAPYGPKIKVKISPIGVVTSDFKSEVESAGINQTRYKVYINVNTNLQVIVPFVKEKMNVVSTIPIAETLIVGKVPSSYFSDPRMQITVPNTIYSNEKTK